MPATAETPITALWPPPIYQTSTFTFTSADHAMGVFSGEIPGYDYTRAGNPTVRVFEEKIADFRQAFEQL